VEQISAALGGESAQVLDGVTSLLDKPLLQRSEQDTNTPRLLMLETLREYGWEALEALRELEATRLAHAQFYLALLKEFEAPLLVLEQQQWFALLEREHDNLRAALRWSVEQEGDGQRREIAWRLAGALYGFWIVHGHVREGQQFVERVLARDEGITAPVRAKVLNGAGWLALWQGESERAEELSQESLMLYRELHDQCRIAVALNLQGWVASARDDASAATA
jgi:predicted ATPase